MPNRPPDPPGPWFTAQLTGLDHALPGTLARRYMRCGKTNCRCKADPPILHGPYMHWTRTVAGKTVTRSLTPDQARRYQALSLIHISEPTRLGMISYAVFC